MRLLCHSAWLYFVGLCSHGIAFKVSLPAQSSAWLVTPEFLGKGTYKLTLGPELLNRSWCTESLTSLCYVPMMVFCSLHSFWNGTWQTLSCLGASWFCLLFCCKPHISIGNGSFFYDWLCLPILLPSFPQGNLNIAIHLLLWGTEI